MTTLLWNSSFYIYLYKVITTLVIVIAFISVTIQATLIELFRNVPDTSYTLYAFVSILVMIMYLLFEQSFNFNFLNSHFSFKELSNREKEVGTF